MADFLTENFITPLCKYYTPVNTIVYGLILIVAVYGLYKLLRVLKVDINKKFFIAVLPFIIYGGWTRALNDHAAGIYNSVLFCSPPIYFFVFVIALASLLTGLLIQRKLHISYEKVMLAVGIALLLFNATLTRITNFTGLFYDIGLIVIFGMIFFGIHKLRPKLLSLENAGIITSHLLDASSSFVAITFFGFYEQHVLPGLFPLKIIVVWFVLYYIDKSKEDKFYKNYLKIIILILGLALGIRDFLTVSMLSV
jgi:uncharacterized membrane protein